MLKRLLFGQMISDTRFRFSGSVFGAYGLPRSIDTSHEELVRNFRITNNKGNMLIGDAGQRIFEVDRNRSVHADLGSLYKYIGNRDKFSKTIKENFDGIVLTMTNWIRPNVNSSWMAEIIESIEDVNIFVFGSGMQQELNSIDQLPSSSIRLLKILNEKAKIFGVRGEKTREFLVSNGITNAIALGCPTIYLYPENIINLQEVSIWKIKNILSAGYLANPGKLTKLVKPFCKDELEVDYVIQNKISDFSTSQSFYNDATGECDSGIVKEALRKKLGNKVPYIPFRKFYHFNNVEAWRHCCSRYDLYIGDRLHGGIAALQAGIPAIIIYNDLRVQELTEFWGIPSISLQDFSESRINKIITEYLSSDSLNRFKKQYISKLTKFANCVESNGLVLANKKIKSLIESQGQTQDVVKSQKAA